LEVAEALQNLAKNLLEAASGTIDVTDKLERVAVLTEQLLLLAFDAVEVVAEAAPAPQPNGKGRQRLLVALLAATMGSPATFPNAEAEKTGKRLEEQVVAVRVKRPRKAATKAVQERQGRARCGRQRRAARRHDSAASAPLNRHHVASSAVALTSTLPS